MMTLERIFGSVEYRWREQQAKAYGVFWLLITGVIMLIMLAKGGNIGASLLAGGALSLLMGIVFLCFVANSLGKNKKLVKNYDRYEVYSVLLDSPVVSKSYRRFSYFVLRFRDKDGTQVVCQTNPIWGFQETDLFPLPDYRDRYADILYDRAHNKVYVIGLTETEDEE